MRENVKNDVIDFKKSYKDKIDRFIDLMQDRENIKRVCKLAEYLYVNE